MENNLIFEDIMAQANSRLTGNQQWLNTHGAIISNWLLEFN